LKLTFGVVENAEELLIITGPVVGLRVLRNVVPVTGLCVLLNTAGPLAGFGVAGSIDGADLGAMDFSALPGAVEIIRYRSLVLPASRQRQDV
jgi:hypothetical protein